MKYFTNLTILALLSLCLTSLSVDAANTMIAKENEPYAILSPDSTTLSFRCDNQIHEIASMVFPCSNTGSETPGWYDSRSKITKVVIDNSFSQARPYSTYMWFSGMANLAAIEGLDNLNTSEVQYMSYMFRNCNKLVSLDLSYFNTDKVQLMGYMFQGCTNLKHIDLSSFNTNTNTSFYRMFRDCNSLEELNISSFTFKENVESRYFLLNCSGLKSLTIPESMNNVDANAFATVGTAENPCRIYAPDGFDFGVDTSGNSFQYKGGWFQTAKYLSGDANHDGRVNVADVMMAVSKVMNEELEGFYASEADLDKNGAVDISDVTGIVRLAVTFIEADQ